MLGNNINNYTTMHPVLPLSFKTSIGLTQRSSESILSWVMKRLAKGLKYRDLETVKPGLASLKVIEK